MTLKRCIITGLVAAVSLAPLSGTSAYADEPAPSGPGQSSGGEAADGFTCGVFAPAYTSPKGYTCKSSGAIHGDFGYFRTSSWVVPPYSSGKACVQFRGFNYKGHGHWYYAGCGTSGSKTYRWGNFIARGQVKAKNMTNIVGVNVVADF